MAEYVVGTHALVWYFENNARLGALARQALSDINNKFYLPVIALAEVLWMIENGRTSITSATNLLSDIDADPRISIVGLSREIVALTVGLKSVGEMHDRQIVATTLHVSQSSPVCLITRDRNITLSGLVPVVW